MHRVQSRSSGRSLAHLYHYYLHGEQGNVPEADRGRHQDLPQIQLQCVVGKAPLWRCRLSEVKNDLESLYLHVSHRVHVRNVSSDEMESLADQLCGL